MEKNSRWKWASAVLIERPIQEELIVGSECHHDVYIFSMIL